MDFFTVLKYILAVVETGALIGALVVSAKGMKEHKNKDRRKNLLMKAVIYFAVYIALNVLRMMYFPG
ncbi:MAG: hypothetical protein IKW50_05475 [Oscillospiraceae bacterium]|nr:hypothetical protein [Oscillospiraceae bacterium]